jgi:hypothetical protein
MGTLRKIISYPCTNESIPAIHAGLSPGKKDVILSIAGSGDVPFSFALFADEIIAVDKDPRQVEFMKKQLRLLRRGRYKKFLRLNLLKEGSFYHGLIDKCIERRAEYFRYNFEAIRKALNKITIVEGDIFEVMAGLDRQITKVYFSNVEFGCGEMHDFERGLERLEDGGLVYFSRLDKSEKERLRRYMTFDHERTSRARKLEPGVPYQWTPVVYRNSRK